MSPIERRPLKGCHCCRCNNVVNNHVISCHVIIMTHVHALSYRFGQVVTYNSFNTDINDINVKSVKYNVFLFSGKTIVTTQHNKTQHNITRHNTTQTA